MVRKSESINFSDVFQNTENLPDILKKCNNGTSINLLGADEIDTLKDCLLNIITVNNVTEMCEENIEQIKNCLKFLLSILSFGYETGIILKFVSVIKYINSEVFTEEPKIINLISKINEYWMVKLQCPEEIKGMEYLTLKYLLSVCTSERPLACDVQRLSSIRKSISAVPFDKTVPSLRPLLIKLVQKLHILSSEHGQRFIAHVLVLSQKTMMEIHKTVMLDLSSCNKKKASDYGKIYVLAWHVASENMKKILVQGCFQHLIETIMKEQRTSLELNKNSKNILAVLEVWHAERKRKNPDFITMLTNAYQPILWKYLQSGFNVHRCNATNVFFKAFPLQRSGDNAIEAETLFNKQYEVMLSSLTDDCHIVRIIGIREVCNILSLYWNSFNPVQIQSLLSAITKQNANDASSAEGRRMVYLAFQSLVKSPLSREYVKQILPNLAENIHDVNQKVRIAFFQLLICIKELRDSNFKYSDCVSMFNIQYRLAEDNIAVGQWIVKLLMRNYYHPEMPVVEWTKRFIYLIKTYRNSYRNFFFYSIKSLSFINACTIINDILTQMGEFVLSKFRVEKENNETLAGKPRGKKRRNKVPLSEVNGSEVSPGADSNSAKKCAFDDPDVVSGLFDVVTILWVLHDAKLNEPGNEEIRLRLYDTYIRYAQPFINYFKDSHLFLGIITLSGNIPAPLLRINNITLPGYCIKMLKSINIDKDREENENLISMLIALVKWGRGSEILEQITLWLDAAFETKDMNETILPRRRVRIREGIQPNSIVSINVLDTLLKIEYVKLSVMKKNYCELFSLWKFMSRIRKLIETRIEQGEPFEEDLVSDEFLNRCFQRYLKLIPLLKEGGKVEEEKQTESQNLNYTSEVYVNRQKEMESVIEWAENLLFPLLQGENLDEADETLICTALEDILYVSDNMIVVQMVNNLFYFKIAHFALKLLRTRCGICFAKAACRITVALVFSTKLLFKMKDDLQIFSTVVPSLLSHILDVLTNQKFSGKEIKKLEQDLPVIKTCFEKILAAYQDNLSSTFSLKENARLLRVVVSFFVDCLVIIISQEIPREDSTIPIFSSLSQLPPVASSLFTLFHNKKTRTPLFVHVLNTKLKEFDAKNTVACIILLNLYAVADKKVNQTDLKKAVASASGNLNKFKEAAGRKDLRLDDIFNENKTETTTKKTWSSNAATKGTWTKLDRVTDPEKSASMEVSSHDERVEKNKSADDQSEVLQSFHCDGNNMEMNFIGFGFEMLKSIERLIEKGSMEVDESP